MSESLLFALVTFCVISVSGNILNFLYLPATSSKWKLNLNLLSWNFSCHSLNICLLSQISAVIPLIMWKKTEQNSPFIFSFEVYVHINRTVRKFNASCSMNPFTPKLQPYLKTIHVRMCDKGLLHTHKGAQTDIGGGTPTNTLICHLPGPSQEPSAHLHKPRSTRAGGNPHQWPRGRDTLSCPLQGLSQESLSTSVQAWNPS